MFLERTISQIDIGPVAAERAEELGQLAFIQWIGWLPGDAAFADETRRALAKATPFRDVSPAVAVFCDLLSDALLISPLPVSLALPIRQRRGGAQARRALL